MNREWDSEIEEPFDPNDGLVFKRGSLFQDRDKEISEVQAVLKWNYPKDFLDLMGEICGGDLHAGFRVPTESGSLFWVNVLLISIRTEGNRPSVLSMVELHKKICICNQTITIVPFGSGYRIKNGDDEGDDFQEGWWGFNALKGNEIVFVSSELELVTVSSSCSEMLKSSYRQFEN